MGVLLRLSTLTLLSTISSTPLFDIRLENLDHDVVVLKGPPNEAASALIAGKIVLSFVEPVAIKKLSLRLFADLRLNWIEHLESSTATYSKPTRYMKRVYEHIWDGLEAHTFASHQKKPHHTSFLKRTLLLLLLLAANVTPLTGEHVILPAGNHEVPFLVFLPGNTPELVEGLPGGLLVYKLQASLDRGKFSKRKTASRHIRVIRTLTPDAPELAETLSIDNSWPNKIDYTISTPTRAIAVGLICPVHFLLAPMLKGLRLGKITIKLVEYYLFSGQTTRVGHTNDRVITETTIPAPPEEAYEWTEEEAQQHADPDYHQRLSWDRWILEKTLTVPASLSKCTQDVTVAKNLKVRHKLLVVVALKNPNGHTSELRATLPIILYILPFVPVRARYDEQSAMYNFLDNIPELSTEHNVRPKKKLTQSLQLLLYTDVAALEDNEVLFEGGDVGVVVDAATGRPDLAAPPNYGEHIFDTLWSGVSTPNSPGLATPHRTPPESPMTQRQFHSQLTKHLNELSLQRLAEENELAELREETEHQGPPSFSVPPSINVPPMSAAPTYFGGTLFGSAPHSIAQSPNAVPLIDYFSTPSANTNTNANNSTNFLHLSYANSPMAALPIATPSYEVPLYEDATKAYLDAAILSPAYGDSEVTKNPGFASAVDNGPGMALPTSVPKKTKQSKPVRPAAKRNNSLLHLSFGPSSRPVTRPKFSRASSAVQLTTPSQLESSKGSSSDEEGTIEIGVKKHNK